MATLFNHNMESVSDGMQNFTTIGDIGQYSARAFCLTYPEDVLQLPVSVCDNFTWIKGHYQKIKFPCTDRIIFNSNFDLAYKYPDFKLSIFLYGKQAYGVRPEPQWLEIVQRMNSKNEFFKVVNELYVPCPDTQIFEKTENFTGYEGPFPVYLKTDNSASGLGVVLCNNQEELISYIKKVEAGGFQLQKPVEGEWLNLTYFIDESNALQKVTSTRQILKGFVHYGNEFPSGVEDDPWGVTDVLAEYMHSQGMKGFFGFDVVVTNEGPLIIECNPRVNASVYPAVIAKKLGLTEWTATNFETSFDSFENFDLGSFEFDPVKKVGVIVYGWGTVKDKKISVFLAGNKEERLGLERELGEFLLGK